MGEKIKDLSTFHIKNERIVIELNEGYDPNYAPFDIHIQSSSLQYYLTDKDYMKLASVVATARRQLLSLKKLGGK